MALKRSRNHKVIAGVCGGVAEALDWSPNWVRFLFLLSFLIPGPQAIFYVVAWIIIPKENRI